MVCTITFCFLVVLGCQEWILVKIARQALSDNSNQINIMEISQKSRLRTHDANELVAHIRSTSPCLPQEETAILGEKIRNIHSRVIDTECLPSKTWKMRGRRVRASHQIKTQHTQVLDDFDRAEANEHRRQMTVDQRRSHLIDNRLKRENYLQEMKHVNQSYHQFMKEFKKTKPLYEIKQEEFKCKGHIQFEIRRQKALQEIKDSHKPIDMSQIKEHEREYLRHRAETETQHQRPNPQQSPQKHYYRGKSHDIALQQLRQFKQSYKHKECISVQKMKQYCQNVLSRMKQKVAGQLKRRRANTEPLEQARQSCVTDKTTKIRIRVPNQPNQRTNNVQGCTPSIKCAQKSISQHETLNSAPTPSSKPRRPREIRDRYDLQQLIYQNQKRDRKINQNQQLVRLGKRVNIDQAFRLEQDYVNSIKEKIDILTNKR